MAALLNLPSIQDQTAFNLDRWDELCADRELAVIEGRYETDRFGDRLLYHSARAAEKKG